LLGSFLDVGAGYLVGSLAAGFGNRRSDVDVHIIGPDVPRTGVPVMFFLGSTIVDVVHHQPSEVEESLALLGQSWVSLAGGICGHGPTLSRKGQTRLGRWWSAIPMTGELPRLLPEERRDQVMAANARGALAELLVYSALAAMIESHAGDRFIAEGAWRRAGCALLEFMVRARGEPFVGDKWLWRKAERLGLDAQTVATIDQIRDRITLRRVMGAPLNELDFLNLVKVHPHPSESLHLGVDEVFLVGEQVASAQHLVRSGSIQDEVDRVGAGTVLQALAFGLAHIDVDDEALDGALA
jgi:hypothetical protein